MFTYVWSQIRHRAGRSAILALGVALAAASVVVLTGAARTSQVEVTGTVQANARSAYDIVVRPAGSKTKLERQRGLVQGNYLSGLYGGISLRQYHEIEEIAGVDVAAPVANLGYLLVPQRVVVDVTDQLTDDPVQIFRVQSSVVADNGLSRYPAESAFIYFTRTGRFEQERSYDAPLEVAPDGTRLDVCTGYHQGADYPRGQPIFHPDRKAHLNCFSARTPEVRRNEWFSDQVPPDTVGYALQFSFPVQLAAIDPAAEQELVGLGDAAVSGRSLTGRDKVRMVSSNGTWPTTPVIASTRTFLADDLRIRIEELQRPSADRVPRLLASKQAYEFLTGAPADSVTTRTVTAGQIWRRLLDDYGSKAQFIDESFRPEPVTYSATTDGFTVRQVTGNRAIYKEPPVGGSLNYVPVDSSDTQFRKVARHGSTNFIAERGDPNGPGLAKLQVVGTYDPEQLQGFSALSEVPLTSYKPPQVRIHPDAHVAVAGETLLPDRNLGGYVTQPPLLLTTLKGMDAFFNSRYSLGKADRKPVSSIRVRVAGAPGTDPTSQARIERVALDIHRRTGLDVDITLGSSPSPQTVLLPAGRHGRPELQVEEYWVKKGVAVDILEAVDRKSAGLLGLMGVVCALFVTNTATASMRARRPQFGVLACLGWSSGRLFGAAVIELVVLGVVGGVIGLAAALLAAAAFNVQLIPVVVAAVIPGAALLSMLTGMLAASRASRVSPADAVRPAATGAYRARRSVRGVIGLALRSLSRVPGRTAVSALALAVSVAALTVLLSLTLAFKGTIAGTLLGEAVIIEVTSTDYLAVIVTGLLGAAVVAETLSLEVRERAPELAALAATGWRDSELARLLSYEGAAIGLLGSILGAAAGFATAQYLGTPLPALFAAAVMAVLIGVTLAAAASVGPTVALRRMSVPQLLAEE